MSSETGDLRRVVTSAQVQAWWETGAPVRLVDVREAWEWDARRIPGILLMPMSEFSARCRSELDPDEAIICVCEHGIRSARAAEYLQALGYAEAATMSGGMAEYAGETEGTG